MNKDVKLGPKSCIHPSGITNCFPSSVYQEESQPIFPLTKVPVLIVGNKQYQPLVDGHKYLVYRNMGYNVEPSFSICTYKEGSWVPEIINYIIAGVLGINHEIKPVPVEDRDWYIDLFDFVKTTKSQEPALHDTIKAKPEEPDVNTLSLYEFIEKRIVMYREKLAHEAEENERLRREAERDGVETAPAEPNPMKEQLDELNLKIDTIIGWLDANLIDGPTLDRNWEHIKTLTNDILDRLIILEQGRSLWPNIPMQPMYPEPQTPVQPYPGPWGPVITYTVPKNGPQCQMSINDLKDLLYKNNPQSTGGK